MPALAYGRRPGEVLYWRLFFFNFFFNKQDKLLTHSRGRRPRNTVLPAVRIIGGKWRGRKIHFAESEGLRPTPDRVRETLFNWLMPYISEARVLDMFAGSGALGLEALSRGAAELLLLESAASVVTQLKNSLALLKTEQATVLQQRAEYWLTQAYTSTFDIVFLDPPFASGLLPELLQQLENSACLAAHALIYVETDQPLPPEHIPSTWQVHRQQQAGQVLYTLFIRQAAA